MSNLSFKMSPHSIFSDEVPLFQPLFPKHCTGNSEKTYFEVRKLFIFDVDFLFSECAMTTQRQPDITTNDAERAATVLATTFVVPY